MKNLILLHGALGAASQMHELQTALETHFNVYILEFDGHGNKAASLDALDIKHMALELDRFITQHAISDPIVFGYSMGGYVALYHASKLPNKIAKVITLATKFDWNPESSEKESRMLNPEQMEIQIQYRMQHLHSEQVLNGHGNDVYYPEIRGTYAISFLFLSSAHTIPFQFPDE